VIIVVLSFVERCRVSVKHLSCCLLGPSRSLQIELPDVQMLQQIVDEDGQHERELAASASDPNVNPVPLLAKGPNRRFGHPGGCSGLGCEGELDLGMIEQLATATA
jgi:hypothetical protein